MTRALFEHLLQEARLMHEGNAALTAFCPFPSDITAQDVTPFHIPGADLLHAETGLAGGTTSSLRDAVVAAGPHAHWRETYKGTDIGEDFLNRFACYCLIGDGGPFFSDTMRAWFVYMPAHLHYPWHHHPGEEIYLILGGEAEFLKTGAAPVTLRAGDTYQHGASQPHAAETYDHPLMAYVVWRNGFSTLPVLTDPATLQG